MEPAGRPLEKTAPIPEIDVLWITGGLSCDGDTIAMTAATQPSIEDIVLGALPWIPKVNFHNPFIAFENGDEFLRPFHLAAEGPPRPSSWCWKDRFLMKPTRRRATGRHLVQTHLLASRLRPVSGSTGWRLKRGPL